MNECWSGSRYVFLAVFSVLFAACPGEGDDVMPVDAGEQDATTPVRDAEPECTEASQCDDGVACTDDECSTGGYCVNRLNDSYCDDGNFCNGAERCDAEQGCIEPLERQTCDDNEVCTIDQCDEETRSCLHSPRDFDEDGEADWHCEGGTDCDDGDPSRAMNSPEICDDFVDNDCDEVVDENDCGAGPYNDCTDPLSVNVSASTSVFLDMTGAVPDYSLTCGSSAYRDMVLTFTLTEPKDITVTAEGQLYAASVALRTECAERTSELECGNGYPGAFRKRSVPAGTYYVIVASSGPDEVTVEFDVSDATPVSPNDTCSAPQDVSAGGSFTGSLVDVEDETTTQCGVTNATDVFYAFTLAEPSNVSLTATASGSETMSLELRTTCDDAATRIRCTRGSPAAATFYSLPAGTYFVAVEGPTYREVDFTFDVAFSAASAAPEGDTCDNPIALSEGIATMGTLADKQDDEDVSCGFYYRDVVYTFSLAEARDIRLDVSTTGYVYGAISSVCGDETGELICGSGLPLLSTLRAVAAGTYYVLLESYYAVPYTVTLTTSAASSVTPVTGNDACGSAYVVPETGGVFSGNTNVLLNDYTTSLCGGGAAGRDAVYALTLSSRKRVRANTTGSAFDTVLHVKSSTCTGTELYCNDNAMTGVNTSAIDQTLEAGTYYFVVDGFYSGAAGSYVLEIDVEDP